MPKTMLLFRSRRKLVNLSPLWCYFGQQFYDVCKSCDLFYRLQMNKIAPLSYIAVKMLSLFYVVMFIKYFNAIIVGRLEIYFYIEFMCI